MDDTLEVLPGEGTTECVVKTLTRRECEVCGEAAHYKHTFLLERARTNPASSAYGKDDCTFCEDERTFVCADHKSTRAGPDGYWWCSTFPATERFARMFLYWKEVKTESPQIVAEIFPGTSAALNNLCKSSN